MRPGALAILALPLAVATAAQEQRPPPPERPPRHDAPPDRDDAHFPPPSPEPVTVLPEWAAAAEPDGHGRRLPGGVQAGPRSEWEAFVLARHARAFPPDEAVIDLRRLAAVTRSGQLDALHSLFADDGDRPFVVDVSASWCGPCRKAWPSFVARARERSDLRFVLLTIERDDVDRAGLLHFVETGWRAGARLSYPSYALLRADGTPLSPRMRSDHESAVAALDRLRREGTGPAASIEDDPSLAALLAEHDSTLVDLAEVDSLGELASRLEAATGLSLLLPEEVAAFPVGMGGRAPVPTALTTLIDRFGLEHELMTPGGGLPPVLALWPREGGLLHSVLREGEPARD